MSFYDGKEVLVAGGTGMIGSHVVEMLVDQGANVKIVEHETRAKATFAPEYLKAIKTVTGNLTRAEDCERATKGVDCVFQLSAVHSGVLGNIESPVRMLSPNLLIQTNMIDAAHKYDVERYLFTSSACVYSSDVRPPFREEDGMTGAPDKNNEAYAWAKRIGELQAQYYSQEYGMKIAIARPFNTYGPRDNFHPTTSHAVAALIRKAEERRTPFKIWGDGQSTRDFVFVTDTARGLINLLEKHPEADPVNLGTGRGITILALTKLVLKTCGHHADIVYEEDKPGGQKMRCASTDKAEKILGFRPEVTLEEGVERTVQWFRRNKNSARGMHNAGT